MPAEQSFSQLLRNSGIARYNRSIPQIYTRGPDYTEEKDLTFGMKREFPNKYWGKRLQYVQVTNLDSEYGYPQFKNAQDEYSKYIAWKELFYKTGTRANDLELSSKIYCKGMNTSNKLSNSAFVTEVHPSANQKVLGRLLNRVNGGFAVGIGGLVAFLPSNEVPLGMNFHQTDFMARTAYQFTVKHTSAVESSVDKPHVILSLK